MIRRVSATEAADALVTHLGLRSMRPEPPAVAVPAMLGKLGAIQLDPLDVVGTNADLVALARVEGLRRGDVYRLLMPGHAFEHFAKERCLLPRRAFPWYRKHIAETRWWGLQVREERLPEGLVRAVRAALRVHGPATSAELERHMKLGGLDPGRVEPMDWSGWKGTSRAVSMALEVLWTRCEAVVVSRRARGARWDKVWDVHTRAFPRGGKVSGDRDDFLRWAIVERVASAGLLSRASGPHWSTIAEARTSTLPDELVRRGALEEVEVEGSSRRYLAPPGLFERRDHDDDGLMRLLGPLDPLLWDRKLVQHAFDFDYVWEVYKPQAQRRWGYYVVPLLHRGRLVGRFEGKVAAGRLEVTSLWKEAGRFDRRAFDRALARHETALPPTVSGPHT